MHWLLFAFDLNQMKIGGHYYRKSNRLCLSGISIAVNAFENIELLLLTPVFAPTKNARPSTLYCRVLNSPGNSDDKNGLTFPQISYNQHDKRLFLFKHV